MTRFLLPALALLSLTLLAQDKPKGMHPRATPDDYMTKATAGDATYAASLVPADEAKHLFAVDVSQKYLVFEVAIFPNASTVEISADDFVIKRGDKGDLAHVSDGATVASNIQKENMPSPRSRSGEVITEANIGYQSGIDPVTGQRVHGVSYGGGAAVQHGGDAPPPDYPRPGGTYADRELLQHQLEDRSLPTGKFDHPVAGYLYFPKSLAKKDSNGNFVLQHLGEPDSHGSAVAVLPISAKNH